MTQQQKGNISIHAQNIMPIIKRWLYSDKDIFVREMVSNGCDAITKEKMLHPDQECDYRVTVTLDKEAKEIRFADNGIGMTKEELENKIATLTGGRAAEETVFGTITTGASNDIEQATKLARAMITRYGMSRDFDMVAMETVQNQYLGGDTSLACSAETQAKIDQQVVALVKQQHEKALKLLTDNRAKLDELAAFLYEKETITGEEFMAILNKK